MIRSTCSLVFLVCILPNTMLETTLFARQTTAVQEGNLQSTQLYWVFLTTGKSTKDVPRPKIETMQRAHLDNFDRLFKEGKLLIAGPMADPEKQLRGIVVIRPDSGNEIPELFKPDPYIQNGFMKVEAAPMEITLGAFSDQMSQNELEEFRIAVLSVTETSDQPDSKARSADRKYLETIFGPDKLRLVAWLSDSTSPRRAILVFRKMEDEATSQLVEQIPSVKEGHLRAAVMPLYMGKGVLDDAEKK